MQAAQLDLQALRALALRMPADMALPPRLRSALQARDVQGQLTSLNLLWHGDWHKPDIQEAQAQVEGLSLAPGSEVVAAWGTLPGADVPGLSGGQLTLAMTANGGRLDLQTGEGSTLWLPGLLEPSKVSLQEMHAGLSWA